MKFLSFSLFLLTSIYPLSAEQKPITAIFLDIDGVLMGDRISWHFQKLIRNKLIELYGEKDKNFGEYTELQWRIAASYFLSKPAVEAFEKLIERTREKADVIIILSSAWRLDGSVDEIKHQMFAMESFSQWIIDKTPDDDWWRIKHHEQALSPISFEKYGFELVSRADQIDYWTRENQEKWPITNFVIIDDYDECLSTKFPDHFIYVRSGLFSETDAEKAYQILTQGLNQR